jgi:hypothetical protein
MGFPVVYDYTYAPALGPSLGAKSLRDFLMAEFECTNLGVYNYRTVVGGSSLSRHAAGAAFDGGFPYKVGGTESGWRMANWLIANHKALGIQQVIYSRRIWTNTKDAQGWRYYSGLAAHYEHVHVELTDAAAQHLTEHLIRTELNMGTTALLPAAAIEALLILRLKLAYELFPNRDPDIGGLRYWSGEITSTFRAGGDPDKILHDIELGLLSELPEADRVKLAELVTDSQG